MESHRHEISRLSVGYNMTDVDWGTFSHLSI